MEENKSLRAQLAKLHPPVAGFEVVICSEEVALSWKAPAIAFLLVFQIISFKCLQFEAV